MIACRTAFLVIVLVVSLVSSVPAFPAVPQSQAPEPAAPISDLANVDFTADFRVFAVMAALNVAGFKYETPGYEMSDVRKAVTEQLSKRLSAKTLNRLGSFYLERLGGLEPTRRASAYISLALLINGPPSFGLIVDKTAVPDDVVGVLGFEELLKDVNAEGDLVGLWNEYQKNYVTELAEYRPVFVDVIHQTLAYFRIPPRITMDRQIVVIPDLLGPHRVVNARNFEKSYTVVLSPAKDPADNRIQLQHEYLHFLLDSLIAKFGMPLLKHEDELLNLAQNQKDIRGAEYQNRYMGVVAESLIESLLLRLRRQTENPPPDADREMVALVRRGLILAPYFTRQFIKYEEDQSLTLQAQMETVLSGVDPKTVQADIAQIGEIDRKYLNEAAAKQAEERERDRRRLQAAHIQSLLTESQNLMRAGQYAVAKTKLEELLAEDPGNAQAYFYLGQACSRLENHQDAVAWYRKADESPRATPAIRAWSRVRIGEFLAFSAQFDQARDLFTSVAAMEGELDGAKERAQQRLADLPPAIK